MVHDRRYRIPSDPENPFPLGRHVNHDPRAAAYPFAASREASDVPVSQPPWPRRIPILDQGADVTFRGVTYHGLGSCTCNMGVGWLGTDSALRAGLTRLHLEDHELAYVDEALAVELYAEVTANDPFNGAFPPDDTGSDGATVAEVLRRWGLVESYSHTFGGLPDVLAALWTTTVGIGCSWYSSMFYPDANGFVSISPDAYVAGGHEFLANGAVSVEERWVEFDNSWGQGWGVDGRFRMTFDTLDRLLHEDGDGTVMRARVAAPVNPEPSPVPEPEPVPEPTPLPDRPGCLPGVLRALRRLGGRLADGR